MIDGRDQTTKAPALEDRVGYRVFVSYMSGPNLDNDDPARLVKAEPEAVTASFYLEGYEPLGIEVKRDPADPTIFVSWGGVLYVQGPPAEVREQIDRETANQARGAGE